MAIMLEAIASKPYQFDWDNPLNPHLGGFMNQESTLGPLVP